MKILVQAGGEALGKVQAISFENRTIDIRKLKATASVHPEAVFAHKQVPTTVLSESRAPGGVCR